MDERMTSTLPVIVFYPGNVLQSNAIQCECKKIGTTYTDYDNEVDADDDAAAPACKAIVMVFVHS